ncbi:tetratricopeptide repeat protein [Pyrinomonas methylaliphatogenes]|jgi:tetratricopeptide (TPR) repeat protein|uniref:Protein prenyltransferase alpha subunit repeat/Tetratricopeptide repeat n=1 Tax=Pyrinomonas methylaliphatogenes TaxID=454194 RepID=A0A0B6WXI9_9BACT|nr:tetratricopeptide repeat protein [Pyrinomonas methylaliphatogenes]CDM64999.1 Protein prenyltransferase alpha subunit repeat/Tetratricopeptide repeat [Pyrinomonas methylaliphatogenes]
MRAFFVRLGVALIAACCVSGCSVINRIRAKNEINEGARAYHERKYAEAQQHFERALELDPEQKNAQFFIARAIHAQYKPGVDTPENIAKAEAAIEAYKKVLEHDPNNDEAYNAVAYLYGAIKQDDKQRDWIMQRANLQTIPPEKRAEAYTVLASKEWQCSYTITEQQENKQTVMKDGKAIIQYKKPKNQADFDQALRCATHGLELINKAIELNPNSESAWSYKTNLLLEMVKLAEMEGNAEKRAQYDKQYKEAQEMTLKLSEEARRRREAEAKKSPAQKAS